jgi:hypothetical protein
METRIASSLASFGIFVGVSCLGMGANYSPGRFNMGAIYSSKSVVGFLHLRWQRRRTVLDEVRQGAG